MITIYDWFGYKIPIKERYKMIKQAGFDGVLLWWSDGFNRNDYHNGPKIAREAGLFIENIHTPIENQNSLWLDNLCGESLVDCYLKCVVDCVEYNIPTMVVHLPDDNYPYNTIGLNRIKRIAEKAEKLGVNVALENLHNLDNLTYILEQVDSQCVGFCYDCGHHYRYYPKNDLLSEYGSRLMAIHLHDNNGSHKQHGLPFDGTLDWYTIMRKIVQANYLGATAIEAMNWDYEDLTAEEYLHVAFERAKRLESLKTL